MLEMYMVNGGGDYPNNVTFINPHAVYDVDPASDEYSSPTCIIIQLSGDEDGNQIMRRLRIYGAARVIAAAVAQSKLVPYIVQCPKPLSATTYVPMVA